MVRRRDAWTPVRPASLPRESVTVANVAQALDWPGVEPCPAFQRSAVGQRDFHQFPFECRRCRKPRSYPFITVEAEKQLGCAPGGQFQDITDYTAGAVRFVDCSMHGPIPEKPPGHPRQ